MNDRMRNLELRLARLEKRSGRSPAIVRLEKCRDGILETYLNSLTRSGLPADYMNNKAWLRVTMAKEDILNIILAKFNYLLDQIQDKSKIELMVLKRFAPSYQFLNISQLNHSGHPVWEEVSKLPLFRTLDNLREQMDREFSEETLNRLINKAIKECQLLGI